MDSRKLAKLCRDLAENKKAENIVVLDVSAESTVTDFFVIATGTSEPHVRAIVQEIADTLKVDYGVEASGRDGQPNAPWIVLDYFDVIVHVMRPEVREQYQLEELWKDGKRPKAPKPARKTAAPRKPAVRKVKEKSPAS